MKLRAVVFGALVIAATVAVPATAEEGIHVSPGAIDEHGCSALDVWNGDVLVRTITAQYTAYCARLDRTAFLANGILLFGWQVYDPMSYHFFTQVWASDGTTGGTVAVGGFGGFCDGAWRIVGRSAYISDACGTVRLQRPRRHAWHTGIDLDHRVLGAVPGPAALRRAPRPHLLQRHAPHEGQRAVGERRHGREHPRREGHLAGRARLASPEPLIGRQPAPLHRERRHRPAMVGERRDTRRHPPEVVRVSTTTHAQGALPGQRAATPGLAVPRAG